MNKFSFIFTLFLINFVTAQRKIGDGCFNKRYKTNGACILIEDCDKVFDDLFNKDLSPQVCQRLDEDRTVVCCPGKTPSTTVAPVGRRDSRMMCAKYADTVFELRENPALGEPPLNISLCAHKTEPLIVGGKKTKPAEFPHMALIGYDYESTEPDKSNITWNCGGTLISEQWVLTAAHCTATDEFGPAKYVRLGELDYKTVKDKTLVQEFTVIERINHPDYNYYQYDDIGLLKLNTEAKFNKYVRPACLWTKPIIEAKRAIATGWGLTEDEGEPSSRLLRVTLNILQNAKCRSFYSNEFRLPKGIDDNKHLCCGGIKGRDTCQGDSGGPLQIYATDYFCMYYVVGITSTGPSCTGIAPGLFTRVSTYVPWIEDIVWNNKN